VQPIAAAALLLFAVFYSVLHVMTWTFPRYRLPVDAVLVEFAGLGAGELAQWRAKKISRRGAEERRGGWGSDGNFFGGQAFVNLRALCVLCALRGSCVGSAGPHHEGNKEHCDVISSMLQCPKSLGESPDHKSGRMMK
jgi:hypothetical protein